MALSVESLGIPVDTARAYDGCLVPRNGGGWNWIKPFYTAPTLVPCEFVIAHLEDNTFRSCMESGWVAGKAGRYPTPPGNFGPKHQLRAPSGDVFMVAASCKVYRYSVADELVHDLGRVQLPAGGNVPDSSAYAAVFNEDGSKLFCTSVAASSTDHRPCVFTVDTATGALRFLSRPGSTTRTLNGYGYYAWVVGNYGYTLVGEELWDIVATNLTTGVSMTLATESVNAWGYFDAVPGKGLTVRLVRNNRLPGETTRKWWLIDGALVPFVDGQDPPVLRDVTPYSNPAPSMPQIDESMLPHHVLRWRPFGSTGAWTENRFEITYAAPIPVDSLYTLPDGSVVGDVEQYQGFFRVTDGEIENFGAFAGVTEGSARLVVNGLLYVSGYANGPLYVYNPALPWDGTTNPKLLGFFAPSGTLSGVKRANALAYVAGRIYMAGLRDRTATGSGIGYYDLTTKKFSGHYVGLENYSGHLGLVTFPDRVVFGGLTTTGDAQFIVHDLNLVELERQTLGLADTGRLFRTSEPTVVVGVSITDGLAYRWDVYSREFLGTVDLSILGAIGVMTQAPGGEIITVVGSSLVAIDPWTLSYTVFGELSLGGPVTCIAMTDDRTALVSVGAEVFSVAME